jgi:hypothetical protein
MTTKMLEVEMPEARFERDWQAAKAAVLEKHPEAVAVRTVPGAAILGNYTHSTDVLDARFPLGKTIDDGEHAEALAWLDAVKWLKNRRSA